LQPRCADPSDAALILNPGLKLRGRISMAPGVEHGAAGEATLDGIEHGLQDRGAARGQVSASPWPQCAGNHN